MTKISFEQLLNTAGAGNDTETLTKRQHELTKTIAKLESELSQAKSELATTQNKLQTPLKQALQAAKLLNVEIPEQYAKQAIPPSSRANGGELLWQPGPLPGDSRNVELVSKTINVARAMWQYSRGSGGSAGKSGEGILTTAEFEALLKQQTGQDEIKPGQTVELVLPNERHVKVTRSSS